MSVVGNLSCKVRVCHCARWLSLDPSETYFMQNCPNFLNLASILTSEVALQSTASAFFEVFWGLWVSQTLAPLEPFGFWGFWHKKSQYFLTYFHFNNLTNGFTSFTIFFRLNKFHHMLRNLDKIQKKFYFSVKPIVFCRSAGSCLLWFRPSRQQIEIARSQLLKKKTIFHWNHIYLWMWTYVQIS